MITQLPFKRWIGKALSVLFLSAVSFSVHAQTKSVSGTVRSDDGSALPGASVIEKGTSNGTVTNADGVYKITVSNDATLVISFIGMSAKEIPVGELSSIDVNLEPDLTTLNEVVVVDYGYGTVKKTDMTGAVASIGAKDLSRIPMANAEQALSGRLPGVRVMTTDGFPGADVVIRVRGGGSITQDNAPLYVVDGFIVPNLRDIPTTDIESINVLKDASSTAIYGARAANGVVVVTTKKAVAGQTKISLNSFWQFKQLPQDRKYDVLSPYEYVMANYEYAKLKSETDVENFEKFFGKYDDLTLYKDKKPTDWQDELFGDPKLSQYYNLSISGGTDKTKLMLSLTNNTDEGLMLNSGYTRNALNFKIDHEISKRLRFEASTRITRTQIDGAGTAGNAQINIKDAVQTRPVNGLADDMDIDLTQVDTDDDYQAFLLSMINPVDLADQDWRQRTTSSYILNAALNWSIVDHLDFRSMFTTSRSFDENLRYYGPLTSESFNNGSNLPIGVRNNSSTGSYRWFNTLTYRFDKLLSADHNLTFMAGQEISSEGNEAREIRAKLFRESMKPKELFANMQLGTTEYAKTMEGIDINRYSFFGRADYQLKERYLATFTMRADASSKFAKGNRVGYFPAFALGWKMINENFMEGARNVVNDLKLRASYGSTGNDNILADATQFLFAADVVRGPGWSNSQNVFYAPNSPVLYNPYIKWETTVDRNIGVDFSVMNRRISGSLDFYYKSTKDILLQQSIPQNTGFPYQWANIGETSNKGVELSLNAVVIERGDFTLDANFNIGSNRARVEKLDGANDRYYMSNWASTDLNNINDFYVKVGGRVGDIYGYVTDGYYTVDDFSGYDDATGKYTLKEDVVNSGAAVGNTNIRPGFLKLKDLNPDGVITADDRKVIGNTLPKFQGGFGLDGTYKNFDFSVFFNYQYGNDVYNTGKIQYNQFRRTTYGNMLNTMNSDNRFTYIDVEGTYTGTPGEVVTDLEALRDMNEGKTMWSHNSFGVAGAMIHSWAVEDGSFIRLNNLSIGYSLPRDIISKVGMSKLRVYFTGSNLHIWTKYSGYDPEVSTSRNNAYQPSTPGVDYSSFPRSRSYTFGVDLTF